MKRLLIGLVIGFMVALPIGVHADEVITMISKTVEGQFPVTLNGKKIENQAIVIEGISYLPVRAIGEALNMDVGFDAALGISLKQKTSPAPSTSTPVTTSTPTMSKEDKIASLSYRISQKQLGITALKMGLDGRKDDDPVAVDYNKRISKAENELADLQNQLSALQTP